MGRLAQLVEHLVYTEEVGGSIPSSPTNFVDTLLLTSKSKFLLQNHKS